MEKRINSYRPCVFCVVYSDSRFLLLHRKLNWKGWEFPKGGIRKSETAEQAVKREIREETGLKILKITKFSFKGIFHYPKRVWKQKKARSAGYALFAVLVRTGKVKISKTEHDAYKWCSLKEALKLLTWPNQKKCLKTVVNSLRRT